MIAAQSPDGAVAAGSAMAPGPVFLANPQDDHISGTTRDLNARRSAQSLN